MSKTTNKNTAKIMLDRIELFCLTVELEEMGMDTEKILENFHSLLDRLGIKRDNKRVVIDIKNEDKL